MTRGQTVLTVGSFACGLASIIIVLAMARWDERFSGAPGGQPSEAGHRVALIGAGSTFIHPLMWRWIQEYPTLVASEPIDYQPVGSTDGIRRWFEHAAQFAASDAPLTDDQVREAKGAATHVPLALGAVVPTYNLPDLPHAIRFTPDALASIFLGKTKAWNDSTIAAANPDLRLPATPIEVVHRSDGSGTTYVWTEYLSKVSPEWKSTVGASTSVRWPVGRGTPGNYGVESTVLLFSGSIGYVELTYALQNKMAVGQIRNKAGHFVEPTLGSVAAAAESALSVIPEDLRYSITDASGDDAWPASGTTWAIVDGAMASGPQRTHLIAFLRWAIHDGQKYCAPLDFTPLPSVLVEAANDKLNRIEPSAPEPLSVSTAHQP
jgi:phosphate ABC transporter phosphate-binding protein